MTVDESTRARRALINRAKRSIEQQRPAEAGDLARQALALDREDPEPWHLLGVVACLDGRPDEGRRLIRRALIRRRRNATFHNSLGNALLACRDPQGARASFRRAADMAPRVVTHWINLARACMAQDDVDEAVRVLLHAWTVSPANDVVARALAAALISRAPRRTGNKTAHDRGLADLYLGFAAAKHGRTEEASRLFFAAASQAPWLWAAHDGAGEMLARLGDWRGASRWSRRTLVLAPMTASAWARLAELRARQGAAEVASCWFGRALATRPNDPDTLLRLADLCMTLGADADRSADLRRRAALVEPEHTAVPRPAGIRRAAA